MAAPSSPAGRLAVLLLMVSSTASRGDPGGLQPQAGANDWTLDRPQAQAHAGIVVAPAEPCRFTWSTYGWGCTGRWAASAGDGGLEVTGGHAAAVVNASGGNHLAPNDE